MHIATAVRHICIIQSGETAASEAWDNTTGDSAVLPMYAPEPPAKRINLASVMPNCASD
jgi:hypothetical protein